MDCYLHYFKPFDCVSCCRILDFGHLEQCLLFWHLLYFEQKASWSSTLDDAAVKIYLIYFVLQRHQNRQSPWVARSIHSEKVASSLARPLFQHQRDLVELIQCHLYHVIRWKTSLVLTLRVKLLPVDQAQGFALWLRVIIN